MNWEDSPSSRGSLSVPIPMEACYCLEPLPIDAFHEHDDDNDDVAFFLSSGETSEQMALEKELSSLTHQEQESARKSVQGTSFPQPHNNTAHPLEDPNRLAQKLDDLRLSLNTLVTLQDLHQDNNNNNDDEFSTKAYQMALQQNPSYVTDASFLLGFLRAERYDASKAAQRLCLYLTEKLQLFGDTKLTRDILLDDLGNDGLRILQIGGLQVLPHKDAAGRTVVFGVPAIDQEGYTLLGARKAHFYFWTSLAEDDDDYGRIKGIVGVLWRVHNPFVHPTIPIWTSKIRECAPIRLSAYHHCHGVVDNHYTQQVVQLVLPILQKVGKLRYYRAHYGTSLEIQYTLYSQYGCPTHDFPFLKDGQKASPNALFHIQHFQDWMVRRIQIDAQKQRVHPPSTVATTTTWSKSSEGLDSLRASMQFFDESMQVIEISTGDQSLYRSSFLQLLNESLGTIPDETAGAASAEKISSREEESGSILRQTEEAGIPHDETNPQDVLLGRGRPLQQHPGNQRFRQWIETNLEVYEASNKHKKTEIAESIVQEVYKEGGRFLKQQQQQLANHHQLLWEEIDDSTARLKVAYTFRTVRKLQKQRSDQ